MPLLITTGVVVSLLTELFKVCISEFKRLLYVADWVFKALDKVVALVAAIPVKAFAVDVLALFATLVKAVVALLLMLVKAVVALPATFVIAELALDAIDAWLLDPVLAMLANVLLVLREVVVALLDWVVATRALA